MHCGFSSACKFLKESGVNKMDNGMDNILDTYLYESTSLLDQLDGMLIKDEKEGEFSSDDVNEIFRIMHTIKGSSAMMEFHSISTIAHHIEDLFFYIRDKGIDTLSTEHKKELFDLMFKSEDYLRSEVEKVENGTPLTTDTEAFASEINGFLKTISGAGNDKAAKSAESEASVPEEAAISAMDIALPEDEKASCFYHIFLENGVGMENLRAYIIVSALSECGFQFRYYPQNLETDSSLCQDLIDNGFFLAFDNVDDARQAETAIKSQPHIGSYELIAMEQKQEQEETSVSGNIPAESNGKQTAKSAASSSASNTASNTATHAPVKQDLISVSLSKLGALNDIVGEIIITESMVTAAPELDSLTKENFDSFMKSARQLRKLTHDLQDISMSLRMVPVSGVFQKMNRIVRDMKQKLGKDVRLTIIGENTEVDKTIVDSIQDPIMHIVRNSMDHGIEESVDERIAAGKEPQGEIILSATHTSSEVIISVTDDGYGMDPEKLLKKAAERGILTKPESEYTEKEALGLIMLPGFSTNKAVTEFSGRGVGMDVVKKNVETVGGTVSIASKLGEGTTISLNIPLTLAIVDGMKLGVGKSVFTIPVANIKQSFKVTADQVIRDEYGHEMVECQENFYPVVRLHDFFHIDTEITSIEDGILIWVEAGDLSYCLLVDQLIGQQQVVVKPLPTYLNVFDLKSFGIGGCTILGDGNISLILDAISLYTASTSQL